MDGQSVNGTTEAVLEELGEYLQTELEYVREAMEAKAGKYEEPENPEEENGNVVGDTAVGYAVKIELEEMGFNLVTYVIFEEQSAYMVMALENGNGTEAFEVAECIINTAQIN